LSGQITGMRRNKSTLGGYFKRRDIRRSASTLPPV
jgi:hypothetical protein